MSSVNGIITALDMVITASTAIEKYNEAVKDINAKLQKARDEGRDISWDEIDESQSKLDAAIEEGRKMGGGE